MKTHKQEKNFSNRDERIAILETNSYHIAAALVDLKQEIQGLRKEIKEEMKGFKEELIGFKKEAKEDVRGIKEELIEIKKEVNRLSAKIDTQFYWMIGGFASILGIIAHAFRWI